MLKGLDVVEDLQPLVKESVERGQSARAVLLGIKSRPD